MKLSRLVVLVLIVSLSTSVSARSRGVVLPPSPENAPQLSAETSNLFPVSDAIASPSVLANYSPAVAVDGDRALIVWYSEGGALQALLTDAAGQELQHLRLTLTAPTGKWFPPAVVSTGSAFIVAWMENSGAYVAAVGRDGTVLHQPRQVVPRKSPSAGSGSRVSLAWNGDRILLCLANPSVARLQLLSSDLEPLGPQTPLQGMAGGYVFTAAVASVAGDFVAVWSERNDSSVRIYAAPVSRQGHVSVPRTLLDTLSVIFTLDVASRGDRLLVVWQEESTLFGKLVDRLGQPLSAATKIAEANSYHTVIAAAGADGYLVGWTAWVGGESWGIAVPVDVEGAVAGEPRMMAAGELRAIDSSGKVILVLHTRSICGSTSWSCLLDVRLTRHTGQMMIEGDRSVGRSARDQQSPRGVFDGTVLATVWIEHRTAEVGQDLFFGRVPPAGQPLDGAGVLLGETTTTPPAIASNGDLHLVAWQQGGRIVARRISREGVPLGSELVTLGETPLREFSRQSIAAASDGEGWLVVWNTDREVIGRRVSREGVAEPSAFPIASPSENQPPPGRVAVLWNGREYDIVWQQLQTYAGPCPILCPTYFRADLHAARVTRSGLLLDIVPIVVAEGNLRDRASFSLASGPAGTVVVWLSKDVRTVGPRDYIHAARLHEGQVLRTIGPEDEGGLSEVTAHARSISMARVTGGFAILWNEVDLTGTRYHRLLLRDDLTAPAPAELVVQDSGTSTLERRDASFDLVSYAGGTAMLFRRWSPEPPYGGVGRIFAKLTAPSSRARPVRRQ
jgi:hypothetical protein